MSRLTTVMVLAVTLAVFLTPTAAAVGEQANLKDKLSEDLVGKTFELRVAAASNTCIYSGSMSLPQTALVDTEIGSFLAPSYYVRADRLLHLNQCNRPVGRVDNILGGTHITSTEISVMHPPGSILRVQSVDLKSDRIEIRCQVDGLSGDDGYVKIKMMLGQGYQSKTVEQVEIQINRALLMPAIDRLQRARGLLPRIVDRIAKDEALLKTADPEKAVAYTKDLITEYGSEISAQKVADPSAVPALETRLSDLSSNLNILEASAAAHEAERAHREYESALTLAKGACNSAGSVSLATREDLEKAKLMEQFASETLRDLSAKPATAVDADSVEEASALVEVCSATIARMQTRISAREQELLALEQQEAARVRDEQRLQALTQLNDSFAKMKRQQRVLDQKLVAEFGADAPTSTNEDYKSLLRQMYQNRQQASQLGDASATETMEELARQFNKLR